MGCVGVVKVSRLNTAIRELEDWSEGPREDYHN
jgi:hypothetical protein